eukprot:CAMPEP_0167783200 /NCGR_PEP_ID=MMETSP0111_2-20121227/6938_1 /TAXON_ID=91324 /ORGANISM="Lotharella globosa, Strain CCCM811" /LENGTH=79 /DNA_ID=CAMNT_0007674111 /DNA_START=146 /DNA_END=382 /DNA_ORIENTATION=+
MASVAMELCSVTLAKAREILEFWAAPRHGRLAGVATRDRAGNLCTPNLCIDAWTFCAWAGSLRATNRIAVESIREMKRG